MLSSFNEFTKLKKDDYFKSLYGNIGEQIRGNFISPKMFNDISKIGSNSSDMIFSITKDHDKNSSNPKLVLGNLEIKKKYGWSLKISIFIPISNECDTLKLIIQSIFGILVINETKTDSTFHQINL